MTRPSVRTYCPHCENCTFLPLGQGSRPPRPRGVSSHPPYTSSSTSRPGLRLLTPMCPISREEETSRTGHEVHPPCDAAAPEMETDDLGSHPKGTADLRCLLPKAEPAGPPRAGIARALGCSGDTNRRLGHQAQTQPTARSREAQPVLSSV